MFSGTKATVIFVAGKLHGFDKLSRMNPNAASIVGKGYNPISFAVGLPQDLRSQLIELVSPLGNTPVVDDNMIENYAVISAMGPTYFWFQFDALRQQAESFGMTEKRPERLLPRCCMAQLIPCFLAACPHLK